MTDKLKTQTLKLLKRHLNANRIVFKESNKVSVDLTDSQIRTLLKHEFGKVSKKDFNEKLTELFDSLVTYVNQFTRERGTKDEAKS